MRKRFGKPLLLGGLVLLSGVLSVPQPYWSQWLGEEHSFAQKLSDFSVTLGLDLAGGTELDYRIDLTEAEAQNSDEDPNNDIFIPALVDSVRDALEQRINPAGVGEITVRAARVDQGHHILVQLPPSSNVEQIKRDAEKDNRLRFYTENPGLLNGARLQAATAITKADTQSWESLVTQHIDEATGRGHDTVGWRYRDQINDSELAEKLFSAENQSVLQEVIDTQTEVQYTIDENGALTITSAPRSVLGVIKITGKRTQERSVPIPAEASARHILFGYPGATRATEPFAYADKEAAETAAQELLQRLIDEGTAQFSDLAKEFSTEGAAQTTGGDLGSFGKGVMAPPFEEAVFSAENPQLLPKLVKTDFGFHIIEVLSVRPESTEQKQEPQVSYEMLYWDQGEVIWEETELNGKYLEKATPAYDQQTGQPLVHLYFSAEGGELFATLTGAVAARDCPELGACRIGIKVGEQWVTRPTVSQKILGRTAQITGQFTFDTAKSLAADLNLGAIEAPVDLSGQTTIEPQLGTQQWQASIKAAFVGLLGTVLLIIGIYRFAGVVASAALLLYVGLFVSILKLWPVDFGGPIVLTLAGMAGIALSIGLAVDGNILIFERIREEIFRGKPLSQAVDLGFARAWVAIRDSNLTTLLTCVILFSFGSSIIKGFAITLIIGTILSMFTVVVVSYTLIRWCLRWAWLAKHPELLSFRSSKK